MDHPLYNEECKLTQSPYGVTLPSILGSAFWAKFEDEMEDAPIPENIELE